MEFDRYCAEHGIECQLTAPYSPQQNGVVDQRNQRIVNMARCMMKAKSLPSYFWGQAMSTTVFILNRSPTRVVDGKASFEAWHDETPTVHFLCTFGCIAHVKNTQPGLKKLNDRSCKTIFVRYESGSKANRCYDLVEQCIVMLHDIVFDKAGKWCWEIYHDEHVIDAEPFTVKYITEVV
jgi:hypothetical protein